MSFTPEDRQRLLDALVSLAAQDGLGEQVYWTKVEPALMELVRNPVADRDLRRFLPLINDVTVVQTLEDWLTRAARERDRDARASQRNAEELVMPLKRFGYGFGASGIAVVLLGTAALGVALPLIGAGLVLTGGGIYTGHKLRKNADEAAFDRDVLTRLADICREDRDVRQIRGG